MIKTRFFYWSTYSPPSSCADRYCLLCDRSSHSCLFFHLFELAGPTCRGRDACPCGPYSSSSYPDDGHLGPPCYNLCHHYCWHGGPSRKRRRYHGQPRGRQQAPQGVERKKLTNEGGEGGRKWKWKGRGNTMGEEACVWYGSALDGSFARPPTLSSVRARMGGMWVIFDALWFLRRR